LELIFTLAAEFEFALKLTPDPPENCALASELELALAVAPLLLIAAEATEFELALRLASLPLIAAEAAESELAFAIAPLPLITAEAAESEFVWRLAPLPVLLICEFGAEPALTDQPIFPATCALFAPELALAER